VDLQLFARVLWRFRFVVLIGLGLALAAAFLLFVRVELDRTTGELDLIYREDEEWAATTTLLVTQRGFPWGRSVLDTGEDEAVETTPSPDQSQSQEFADSTRFSTLALLYARLATSAAVRDHMLRDGPVDGEIEANPVMLAESSSLTLPLVELTGTAGTPGEALALTRRATSAFELFLSDRQAANAIPPAERVIVTVVDRPVEAELARPRPLTLSLVVFLGVILATLGLVLALENLWPRARADTGHAELPQRSAG
jgi:hypothetical protein